MIFLFILLIHILQIFADREWIDPHDMINYDRSRRISKRHPAHNHPVENVETKPIQTELVELPSYKDNSGLVEDESVAKSSDQIMEQKQNVTNETLQSSIPSCVQVECQDTMFYTVFMKKFIHLWKGKVLSNTSQKYSVRASISRYEYDVITNYTQRHVGNINDVHDAIMSIFQDVADDYGFERSSHESLFIYLQYNPFIWQMGIVSVAVLILCIFLRAEIQMKKLLMKFISLSFIISVPMNWYQLYKKEEAKQMSIVSPGLADECQGKQLSWWSWIGPLLASTVSIQKDRCSEYYEHLITDPIYMTTLTEAIAVTIVKFFVRPLGIIGDGLGEFLPNLLKNTPVILWPVPIVVILMVVFMSFRYTFRIPFVLSIEPTDISTHRTKELELKMDKILTQLRCINDRRSSSIRLMEQEFIEPVNAHGASGDAADTLMTRHEIETLTFSDSQESGEKNIICSS